MFNKKNYRFWMITALVISMLAVMVGSALAASQTFYAPQRGVNVRMGPTVSADVDDTFLCGTEVAVEDSTLVEAGGHDWMQLTDGTGRWVATDVMTTEPPVCANTAAASTPQKFALSGTATDTTALSRTWSDWGVEVEGLNPATMAKLAVVTVSSTVTFTVKVNQDVWYQAATSVTGVTPRQLSLKAGGQYILVANPDNNVFWKSAVSATSATTNAYCNGSLVTPDRWGLSHCYSPIVAVGAVGNEIGEFDVPGDASGADLVIQVQLESAYCKWNGMDADGGVLYGSDGSTHVVVPDVVNEFTLKPGVHYSIGNLGGCP